METEKLKKIKTEIEMFEKKNNKKMSNEEKIRFIEEMNFENIKIEGILYKSQNHFDLKNLTKLKIESIQFYYSPNNVSEFPNEGYFTCESLKDFLIYKGKNAFYCKSNKTVYYDETKISIVPSVFYITLIIPQLNWKKEFPIVYSEINAFEISEEIIVPVSCKEETNISILFKTPDSKIIKDSEITFNIKYMFT